MKIAVPVHDENLKVFTRTGRAPFFALFEAEGKDFKLLKLVPNQHAHEEHGEHHHEEHTEEEVEAHRRHLKELKGCDYILARALGPNMEGALLREGIKPVKVAKNDGDDAEELVKNFLEKES